MRKTGGVAAPGQSCHSAVIDNHRCKLQPPFEIRAVLLGHRPEPVAAHKVVAAALALPQVGDPDLIRNPIVGFQQTWLGARLNGHHLSHVGAVTLGTVEALAANA